MTAWDYPERKRKSYVWSYVQKTMQRAFTLMQVCEIFERDRVTMERYILHGKIDTPQRIYTLDGNFKPGKYFFSEDDIMKIHEYLSSVHHGRPRKDGLVTNLVGMSKSQLRALVEQDAVLYTKTDDGEFIPVWKEQVW